MLIIATFLCTVYRGCGVNNCNLPMLLAVWYVIDSLSLTEPQLADSLSLS